MNYFIYRSEHEWLGHSGLAMYDNTARLHDPLLMRYASPDPLYAKFGPLSPWSHCAADPLNHFDPDGRDIFRLEQDGSFTFLDKSHKNDLIIAENGDKITLKNGTINSGESGNYLSTPYTRYSFSSDGFEEFKFLAEHTNVEWDRMELDDGTSKVGTSNSDACVASGAAFYTDNPDKQSSLVAYDHSHSLEPTGEYIQSGSDVKLARTLESTSPNIICRVFFSKDFNGTFSIFNGNSPFTPVPDLDKPQELDLLNVIYNPGN